MSKKIYILIALQFIFCSMLNAGEVAPHVVKDTAGVFSGSTDNAASMLLGRVAGVRVSSIDGNPLGNLNVNVRGVNTLRTDNRPLWIVDGVYVSSDISSNQDAFWQYGEKSYTSQVNWLQFLSASDIESIEVLKNVSATAIYGSRGANGVIIVNTKKGSQDYQAFDWQSSVSLNMDGNGIGLTPGIGHNHRLAFNGGTKGTRYNVSTTLRSIDGVCNRNNGVIGDVKGNFETKANETVWFGINALFSAGKTSSPNGTSWLGAPSYTLSLREPALSGGISADDWTADYDDDTENYRALLSTDLRVNITKSLSAKLSGGIDFQDDKRIIWYGKKTDFGAVSESNPSGGAGSIMTSLVFNYNFNLTIDWSRFFGVDHYVGLVASGEISGFNNQFNTMNARNFINHELRGKATATTIGNSTRQNHIFGRNYLHIGAYATAEYSWRKTVGANAVFRYDTTPKYNNLVSNMYPSAEGWVDMRKLLFDNSQIISQFKIRGGWGKSGLEKYVPFEFFKDYLTGSYMVPDEGTEPFYDGMERVVTGEWHIGADLSFLDSRLYASLSFYDRSTDDSFEVYCNGAYDAKEKAWRWSDASKASSRLSSVINRGYEITLGGFPVRNSTITWNLDCNLTFAGNQMSSSNPEDFYGKVIGHGIYCTSNAVGLPLSTLFGYKADASGNYLDVTGEGIVTPADKIQLGNTIPVVYGGLQSTLSLYGVTFELYCDGAAGHKIANVNRLVRDGVKDSQGNVALSSNYVENGDYIRLSYVGVSYAIPVKSKWIKKLGVSLSGRNLVTLSSYSGWNPDVNSFGINALSTGVDYGSFPVSRSLVLGVSARF